MCHQLAAALGHVTVLQKGPTGMSRILSHSDLGPFLTGLLLIIADIISNGRPISYLPSGPLTVENEIQGGLKRCGGQGDILSGTVGVLAGWAGMWGEGDYKYVLLSMLSELPCDDADESVPAAAT